LVTQRAGGDRLVLVAGGEATDLNGLAVHRLGANQGYMGQRHRVGLLMLHYGTPRDQEARAQLAAVLPGAEVGEADEVGVFEIVLDADDQEGALQRAWDALAASGTDDHIVFLEHPELPEHWRRLSRRPDDRGQVR
jgi:hypothetical protein